MSSVQKAVNPDYDDEGVHIITQRYLSDFCDASGLYVTPSLNEKLFVHHKGFIKIQNLHEYVNLKALYLDHNSIQKIENLHMLKSLRCLYLHNNQIERIENLEELQQLTILNVSHNRIRKIENLQNLSKLQNLNVSYNALTDSGAIKHLSEYHSITTLDLSYNPIKYSDDLMTIFTAMKGLICLYLKDNPLRRDFVNYRKVMIASIPNLTYLDERPVYDEEKRLAKAFQEGGQEGESNERMKMQEEKKERERIVKLENKEKDEKARLRKKLELEKIQVESVAEKEKLLITKNELLVKRPERWECKLKEIEHRLERVNRFLDVEPNKEENENDLKVIKVGDNSAETNQLDELE